MDKNVVLVASDVNLQQDLKAVLDYESANLRDQDLRLKIFETLPTVEEAVVHAAPHIFFIHVSLEDQEEKLFFLDQLSRVAERVPIIVISENLTADLMLACIKKGVRDFLKQPISQGEIQQLIKRFLSQVPQKPGARGEGMTYSFFSYKGGIGNTFLSSNTAVALSRRTEARVLLWDLVIQNGDIPFFFDYEPVATLTELLENLSRIDESYLDGVLPLHASGISILAGPKRPEEAEGIRSDQIQALHRTLSRLYDYIIIDAGHALTDTVINVMDHSQFVLLTTDLHLPVLKNTLRCIEVFERLGYGENKFKILLNRYNSKYEQFDLAKAQDILKYPIAFSFSNDYITSSRSLNAGIPVADLDQNSVLIKQFERLADLLTREFKESDQRSDSFFDKLKGVFSPRKKSAPVTRREEPEAAKETTKDSEGSHAA